MFKWSKRVKVQMEEIFGGGPPELSFDQAMDMYFVARTTELTDRSKETYHY